MNTLYIIGNGFDLHHGFNTSFKDFKEYVRIKNANLYNLINEYDQEHFFECPLRTNWSDIEESLGLNPYKIQTNSRKDDSNFEPTNIYLNILEVFKNYFSEWILECNNQIKNSNRLNHYPNLDLNKNNLFLTFNYTCTLEYLYGIDAIDKESDLSTEHIIYIHNRVLENKIKACLNFKRYSAVCFGRATNEEKRKLEKDPNLLLLYQIFNKPVERLFKINFLSHLNQFAQDIKQIQTIKIYGHSLKFERDENGHLTEDGYYFEKIKELCPKAKWIFYYYSNEDIEAELKAINSLGLGKTNCEIRPETELYKASYAYEKYSLKAKNDYIFNKLLNHEIHIDENLIN